MAQVKHPALMEQILPTLIPHSTPTSSPRWALAHPNHLHFHTLRLAPVRAQGTHHREVATSKVATMHRPVRAEDHFRRARTIMLRRAHKGTLPVRVREEPTLEVEVQVPTVNNKHSNENLHRTIFPRWARATRRLETRWSSIGKTSWVRWVSCEIACPGTNQSSTSDNNMHLGA